MPFGSTHEYMRLGFFTIKKSKFKRFTFNFQQKEPVFSHD